MKESEQDTTGPCLCYGCRYVRTPVPLTKGLCQMCAEDGCTPTPCTCEIVSHPDLDGEFGPGVSVEVIKVKPGCAVHTGPPNLSCCCCTHDVGDCTCNRPCGAITCTGGF